MNQLSRFVRVQETMRINSRNVLRVFCAASIASSACVLPANGEVLFWRGGGGSDNLINHPQNWIPAGRPADGNAGEVADDFQTGYSTGLASGLGGYTITYKDTSSLGVVNGDIRLTLYGGTELTFQDHSALKVGEHLYLGFSAAHSGGAKLTLAGNAAAVIEQNLIFGNTGTSGSSPGMLVLQGNSSVTVEGVMEWHQAAGGTEVTHHITLADSAKLTIKEAKSRQRNGATLVVNFLQTDKRATPTWTLGDGAEFSGENIQYQINGEETTLDDPRFVLSESALSLAVTSGGR